MPDLSTTADEVTIVEWYVEVGEPVTRGQPIVAVETDKAKMDLESVVDGVLKRVVVDDNETVAAGQVIAIIEVEESGPAPTSTSIDADAIERAPAPMPRSGKSAPSSAGGGMFARNRRRRDTP